MLDDFLIANREAILERSRAKVAARQSPKASEVELTNGIPVFLDQLVTALCAAKSGAIADHEQLSQSAGRHGRDLLSMGLTLRQVVNDYGNLCQTITELAIQQKAPIGGADFQTLNLCLDDAIAAAVSEYAGQRERDIMAEGTERIGTLAHELRNLLNTAMLSFEIISSGQVSVGEARAYCTNAA